LRFLIPSVVVLACVACGTEPEGAVDSGAPVTGGADAGAGRVDAGVVEPDAGAAEPDAGVVEPDAGVVEPDAGAVDPGVTALEVAVTGSKSQDPVCVALFADGAGFPDNAAAAIYRACTPFAGLPVRITNLSEGTTYGVSVFVDANGNSKLDTNLVGMPSEGFGFSNNPSIGFSSPKWADVSFPLNASTARQTIKVVYCSVTAGGCK
jgi:uncharacterized protein (DUF2141 family)